MRLNRRNTMGFDGNSRLKKHADFDGPNLGNASGDLKKRKYLRYI